MKANQVFSPAFRAIIGFLVGMFLAAMTKTSGTAGFWVGVVIVVVMFLGFWAWESTDRWFGGVINKLTGGGGIKPARKPANAPKPHWIARYGWIFAVAVGFAAEYVLPEGALSWLS